MINFLFKKSIVVKLLFLVFCIVLIFVLSKKDLHFSNNNQLSQYQKIILGPEGFSPDSLIIEKGTTVEFVNMKGGPAWPASDPHPAHTTYSDFDSREPVVNGESWSFTFNNLGVWSFHDHLSPYFIGKITVVEKSSKNIISSYCGSGPNTKECWNETLTKILNEDGLEEVMDKVADYYVEEPSFANNCHDVMHDIGHKAYKNYLDDKDSVINPKAFYCANGFYHGLMASFIVANPGLVEARDFCNLVGKKLEGKAPDAKLQCFHGIGHGLLEDGFENVQNKTSVQNIIVPALANCEMVTDVEAELYRCASGIFNGIANFYLSEQHNLKINPNKPFATCEIQEEKFKQSCYGNFNSLIFSLAGGDFSKASVYIIQMKDSQYKKTSIRYLAGLATLRIAKVNPEKAILACRDLGDLKIPCIEGFAHGFLEHGEPNNEWKESVAFCENKIMTKDESDACLHYALSWLGSWYSEEKTLEICDSVKSEYKKFCQKI